jgi:hypothetical protein
MGDGHGIPEEQVRQRHSQVITGPSDPRKMEDKFLPVRDRSFPEPN